MKKAIQKEIRICDCCKIEQAIFSCMECDKDFCYECGKTQGVEYNHAVYFTGSGDGYYCTNCDTRLSNERTDSLHNAYINIKTLKNESILWSRDFKERSERAEEEVEQLTRERGLIR